jgi:hypothetical protein
MSDQDTQAQIVREVGDPEGTLPLAIVAALWTAYASRALIAPALQALYTKRALLDTKLAEERENTTFSMQGDLQDIQSDRFKFLIQMRVATQTEIERVEGIAVASTGHATGMLDATEAQGPLYPGYPDASSPVFTGSPYYHPWGYRR